MRPARRVASKQSLTFTRRVRVLAVLGLGRRTPPGLVGAVLGRIAIPVLAQSDNWGQGDKLQSGDRATMGGFSTDRAAFTDARLGALHTGLKLTPDQEKLWPPVEQAIRALAAQRRDQAGQARETRRNLRANFPAAVRSIADSEAARADTLRRLADAVAPLYATLDEGQKHRAAVLMRSMRPHGRMFAGHGRHDRHWNWRRANGSAR